MNPRPKPGEEPAAWRESVWKGRRDSKKSAASTGASTGASSGDGTWTPGQQAEMEAELALDYLLGMLPTAIAPTNLATRVLNEVAREDRSQRWGGPSWVPGQAWQWARRIGLRPVGIAFALSLAVGGVLSQRSLEKRLLMAREVAEVTEVTAVAGVDILRNFDAISALGADARMHPSDVDLMAAMVPLAQ